MTGTGRSAGTLDPAAGAGVSDHACWGYSSDEERAARASAWLHDGIGIGQRALYVADAPRDALVAELASVPDVDAALERGALVAVPSADVYDLSGPIDAEAQLAVYAGAVDQAIADGYRGLRVAADITPLVADASRRPSHAHWEQVADRYISDHPLAPLCLYDTRAIQGIEPILCVHPLRGPRPTLFGVYGTGPTDAAIDGELDASVTDTLVGVLEGLPATDRAVDVSRLGFVDARSAWVLHDVLQRRRDAGQPLSLTGASGAVRRVWWACGFDPSFLAAG